jgi:hypothetical protein
MSVFNINLKKSENFGYGFSLLGIGITGIGSPHVIYEIISDSPAAEEKVGSKKTATFSLDQFNTIFFFYT